MTREQRDPSPTERTDNSTRERQPRRNSNGSREQRDPSPTERSGTSEREVAPIFRPRTNATRLRLERANNISQPDSPPRGGSWTR